MRLSDRAWSDAAVVALLLAGSGYMSPNHGSAEYLPIAMDAFVGSLPWDSAAVTGLRLARHHVRRARRGCPADNKSAFRPMHEGALLLGGVDCVYKNKSKTPASSSMTCMKQTSHTQVH